MTLLYGEPQISPAFLFNNLLNLDMLLEKNTQVFVNYLTTYYDMSVCVLSLHAWETWMDLHEANLPFLSRTLIHYFIYSFAVLLFIPQTFTVLHAKDM